MQNTKKKMSLSTIIVVTVVLFSLVITGYFWYKNQLITTAQADVDVPITPPVFLTLQPFTVSLPTVKNGYEINKVFYVGMVLRVKNEEQKQMLNQYLPEVRSDLLLLLAKQDVSQLNTETGKIALTEQVKTTLSRYYNGKTQVNIDDVLFTDFIIR